jgi:hypothetical protein
MFNLTYWILGRVDPLVRAFWRRFGLGNVMELTVARPVGDDTRSRLVGLLRADGHWYLGHPNGHAGWTRDLQAAGEATLRWHLGGPIDVRAELLRPGSEREAAVRATIQHPFPGNLIYWLGRRHVRSVGVFFRVEPARDP